MRQKRVAVGFDSARQRTVDQHKCGLVGRCENATPRLGRDADERDFSSTFRTHIHVDCDYRREKCGGNSVNDNVLKDSRKRFYYFLSVINNKLFCV